MKKIKPYTFRLLPPKRTNESISKYTVTYTYDILKVICVVKKHPNLVYHKVYEAWTFNGKDFIINGLDTYARSEEVMPLTEYRDKKLEEIGI